MKVFNIGDEVICTSIDIDNWYQIGDKHIIAGKGFEDDDQDWVYNIEGQHRGVWIVAKHFELYKSKEGHYFYPEEHVAIAEGSKEEEVNKALGIDMVNAPKHYQLFHKDDIEGDYIEVKHVVKAVLERWEQQENISFDFYQAGCYKELLQYLLRAPLKNNIEDVQKAGYYLKEVVDEW